MPVDSTDFLDISVDRTTLMPGEAAEVTLLFTPSETRPYSTLLPILINGLWHQSVEVRGEGCELRLELQTPSQQQLHLNSLQIHQQTTRSVGLVNRSRCPVTLSLADAAATLADHSVSLSLVGGGGGGRGGVEAILRPRQSVTMEIRFAPTVRIPPFSLPVVVRVCNQPRPMLVVHGACIAMALALEMDQLAFGQVMCRDEGRGRGGATRAWWGGREEGGVARGTGEELRGATRGGVGNGGWGRSRSSWINSLSDG